MDRTIYTFLNAHPEPDRNPVSTLRADLAERWTAANFPIQEETRDDWPAEMLESIERDDAPGGPTEGYVTDRAGWVPPPTYD